ncbi:MAG: IS256 family transposase [bacterium]
MKRNYHIVGKLGKRNEEELRKHLCRNGQFLLPMVALIEQARMAVDEVIEVLGRASIEAVLDLSAAQVAGPRQPGRRGEGEVVWYGSQAGRVKLSDRKLTVKRPRLRRRGVGRKGEVPVPAYEAMQQDEALGQKMLHTLLHGVSSRNYQKVVPEMAETVGVSRSAVSREAKEAAAGKFQELLERRFEDFDLLVIYLDGMHFGDYTMIGAVGVDGEGRKQLLGLQEGATENAAAAKALLERLVAQGVDPEKRLLFVIDGSKALRAAITAVFGSQHPVQRCRIHKLRNVLEQLPEEQQDQARSTIRAAWRLEPKDGMARLRQLADWFDESHPSAAASLREGLEECFTLNRLGVPASLHRCLATTNLIESPQSGVRLRTRRICRWRDGAMVQRWVAASFLATEKSFRRIMGYRDLWMLEAILRGSKSATRSEVA